MVPTPAPAPAPRRLACRVAKRLLETLHDASLFCAKLGLLFGGENAYLEDEKFVYVAGLSVLHQKGAYQGVKIVARNLAVGAGPVEFEIKVIKIGAKDVEQKRLLVRDVVIDKRLGDAAGPGKLGHGCARETVRGEQPCRHVPYPGEFAFIGLGALSWHLLVYLSVRPLVRRNGLPPGCSPCRRSGGVSVDAGIGVAARLPALMPVRPARAGAIMFTPPRVLVLATVAFVDDAHGLAGGALYRALGLDLDLD